MHTMVDEVYREGKKWNFKPPGEGGTAMAGRRADGRSMDGTLGIPVGERDGMETPEILQGISGPGTPVNGRRGMGRGSEYFESSSR